MKPTNSVPPCSDIPPHVLVLDDLAKVGSLGKIAYPSHINQSRSSNGQTLRGNTNDHGDLEPEPRLEQVRDARLQ